MFSKPTRNPNRQWNQGLFLLLFLVLLSAGIYANTLWNPFVWDDVVYVSTNTHFEDSRYIPEYFTASFCKGAGNHCPYYRPLVSLSYLVDYLIWGKSSFGYHLSNILIHMSVVVLFYIVSLQLFRKPLVSMVGALIFAVHPVHVESVAVVANRTDPLTSVSLLLSLYFFHRHFPPQERSVWSRLFSSGEKGSLTWSSLEAPHVRSSIDDGVEKSKKQRVVFYLISLLFFSLALLTKEVAVLVPLLFLLYDFFCVRSWKGMGDLFLRWKTYLPFGIILVLYFIARHRALGYGLTQDLHLGDIWFRVVTAPSIVWDYFRLQVFPYPLKLYHGSPKIFGLEKLAMVWGVLFMGLYFFVLFKIRRYSKEVTFCGLWFIIFLLPVINLVPIAWPMASERYSYIPSMGIALLVGYLGHWIWGLPRVRHSGIMRRGFLGLFVVILVLSSLMTIMRNRVWSDEIRLWSDAVQKSPDFALGHMNLGFEYHEQGDLKQAAQAYRQALKYNYASPKLFHNLGRLYQEEGQMELALLQYQRLIDMGKALPVTFFNTGIIYEKRNNLERAIQMYHAALAKNPDYFKAHLRLGRLLEKSGDWKGALVQYQEAIRIKPQEKTPYMDLAEVSRLMERWDEAKEAYKQFLIHSPQEERNSRGYAYAQWRLGEPDEGDEKTYP